MSTNLFIEFPPVSTEEWEAAARADLKGRDPGKILYRAEDAVDLGEQPWPERAWQIWAEVASLDAAWRAREHGAEGLVVSNATAEWGEVLEGVPVHFASSVPEWALGLRGTFEGEASTGDFRKTIALAPERTISEQIAQARHWHAASPQEVGKRLGIAEATLDAHPKSNAVLPSALIVPVSPAYFEEIAKFRALRRLYPGMQLIARTSPWHATAYDPHVNLLRATTEAMAAILGGCDALIVGPFTEARGPADELAERLALNTQLLLRDEAQFADVADPAAGSWYIEALTASMLNGTYKDAVQTAFIGVNRYPNPQEPAPQSITTNRATSALEACRLRAQHLTARLELGADAKMARARAAFARDFLIAGGFQITTAPKADLTVLCDADANYPATREFPIVAAGPDFNRNSDHAAVIAAWQDRLGIQ